MPNSQSAVIRVAAILTILVLLCACSRKAGLGQEHNASVSPMADSIHFQYAVYMLPRSKQDPAKLIAQELTQKYTGFKLVDEIPKEPQEMLLNVYSVKNVQQNYAPPNLEALQYVGRGISRQQMEALQKSKEVLILEFAHPKDKVWDVLCAADSLVEDVARKSGGLVWDEATREIFSPDAWHAKRLGSWEGGVPDISTQITIDTYLDAGSDRANTMGMEKVGLPDVVVRGFSESYKNNMEDLIDLFCQSMAEGARFNNPGIFKLDLRGIQSTKIRGSRLQSLKPNGTGLACLSLKPAVPEEGDPNNRLIQLLPDKYTGADSAAKHEQMVHSFYGLEDSVTSVEDDEETLAASREAREKLPELRQAFNAGLRAGEFIRVEARFETPDGDSEWMWVEVTHWQGDKIKGRLESVPFSVPGLHPGQMVEVKEEDVYDYVRRYPDRHEEGNTTSAILLRKEKEQRGNDTSSADVRSPKQVVPVCD